jgi:hypothetical protein
VIRCHFDVVWITGNSGYGAGKKAARTAGVVIIDAASITATAEAIYYDKRPLALEGHYVHPVTADVGLLRQPEK